ncbi:hypothetical protein ACFWY6_03820 [Streptomyces sp. NPDC059037]|uniref:hypothetical protein n=1 Tax=Streptomyces sp. NPDC059037 TaxID=3346710 RepID=UPI003679204A
MSLAEAQDVIAVLADVVRGATPDADLASVLLSNLAAWVASRGTSEPDRVAWTVARLSS